MQATEAYWHIYESVNWVIIATAGWRHAIWPETVLIHDDIIKWKHFPRYWPFARGIHRSPVNSPHKGQWRRALMFSLICVWINDWVNNRQPGDLRRYRAHYDVIVMLFSVGSLQRNSFNKMYLNIKSAKMWLFRSIPHVFQATISVTDSTHTSMGSHADTGCENEQILCMRMVLCITACINLPF